MWECYVQPGHGAGWGRGAQERESRGGEGDGFEIGQRRPGDSVACRAEMRACGDLASDGSSALPRQGLGGRLFGS